MEATHIRRSEISYYPPKTVLIWIIARFISFLLHDLERALRLLFYTSYPWVQWRLRRSFSFYHLFNDIINISMLLIDIILAWKIRSLHDLQSKLSGWSANYVGMRLLCKLSNLIKKKSEFFLRSERTNVEATPSFYAQEMNYRQLSCHIFPC